jgi:hypothetical protein
MCACSSSFYLAFGRFSVDQTICARCLQSVPELPLCFTGGEQVLSALIPINVMGDGNCCLHAISIALWGIQDRIGVLRRAMAGMLHSKAKFFYSRCATCQFMRISIPMIQPVAHTRVWPERIVFMANCVVHELAPTRSHVECMQVSLHIVYSCELGHVCAADIAVTEGVLRGCVYVDHINTQQM